MKYYEKNNPLENIHRDGLIQIIVEEVNCSDTQLKPVDFPNMVGKITSIFPSEKDVEDYYFIPRKGKNNPSGKLYSRYANSRSKRTKKSIHGNSHSIQFFLLSCISFSVNGRSLKLKIFTI